MKIMLIFASLFDAKALRKPNTDFFHNLYIVFPLLFPHQEGFFVLLPEQTA